MNFFVEKLVVIQEWFSNCYWYRFWECEVFSPGSFGLFMLGILAFFFGVYFLLPRIKNYFLPVFIMMGVALLIYLFVIELTFSVMEGERR